MAEVSSIPKWKKQIPMALTWSRVLVCPFVVYLMFSGTPQDDLIAAVLFILASITDWFDGALARRFEAVTNLGKMMDPVADKILVTSILIMLLPSQRIGAIVVILLLVRDTLVGGVRSAAAADGLVISAKAAGKWKTGLQMVSIPAILIDPYFHEWPVFKFGITLLWISVILSMVSGLQYTLLYFQARKEN